MSNTFRTAVETIVESALSGTGYQRTSPSVANAVRIVEDGITEHAEKAADVLRSFAEENNLPESLVENALIQAGLADAPEPEVEAEPLTTEEQVAALVESVHGLALTVKALVAAAQRNGITVEV